MVGVNESRARSLEFCKIKTYLIDPSSRCRLVVEANDDKPWDCKIQVTDGRPCACPKVRLLFELAPDNNNIHIVCFIS